MRFSVCTMPNAESLRGLTEGALNLAIGFFRDPGTDCDRTHVRTETYLAVARRDHPILSADMTLGAYTAASHVLVSSDGTLTGIAHEGLAERGLSRRVCLAVPSFMPALSIVAGSDFLATLPASLVREHAQRFNLNHRAAVRYTHIRRFSSETSQKPARAHAVLVA